MDPAADAAWAKLGLDAIQRSAAGERPLFRIGLEAQQHFALLAPEDGPEAPPRWAVLSGRLLRAQRDAPLLRPAVGDFVVASGGADGQGWRIEEVLPRRTRFVRRSARRDGPQLVAANVDRVLVVTSPNDDFSPRRIERYLTTIHASGARPALVLNKVDLVDDPDPWLARMRAVALDAPIVATSARGGGGLSGLAPWLGPGSTLALVGSSGVGKSSLINALFGADRQRVRAIREDDAKGRHTTTHRELLRLPIGEDGAERGLLVDTPGMRAIGLWTDPEGVLEAFSDIAALASGCRFNDCRHDAEPGCAVRAAAEAGELSASRLASFRRLRAETAERPRRGR